MLATGFALSISVASGIAVATIFILAYKLATHL
jgi:hypothetical protein